MRTHYEKDCWCDPYDVNYRFHFHRDENGKFAQGSECFDLIVEDFKSFLSECFIEMHMIEMCDSSEREEK
jgi:hypothetical protein